MPQTRKKLVFYVDTECSLSNLDKCSYYSNEAIQKQVGASSKRGWDSNCCPVVYVRTDRNRFQAFCPTRGGPWGEQLPILSRPTVGALKVELTPKRNESWAETIERAARIACDAKCQEP